MGRGQNADDILYGLESSCGAAVNEQTATETVAALYKNQTLSWKIDPCFQDAGMNRFLDPEIYYYFAQIFDLTHSLQEEKGQRSLEEALKRIDRPMPYAKLKGILCRDTADRVLALVKQRMAEEILLNPEAESRAEETVELLEEMIADLRQAPAPELAALKWTGKIKQQIQDIELTVSKDTSGSSDSSNKYNIESRRLCESLAAGLRAIASLGSAASGKSGAMLTVTHSLSEFELKIQGRDPEYGEPVSGSGKMKFVSAKTDPECIKPYWDILCEALGR